MNRGLILIILFFLIRCVWLSFLIPPWEAPDETAHVAYVLYLYNRHELPSKYQPFLPKTIQESITKQRQSHQINKNQLFDRNDYRLTKEMVNIASHPPLYYLYLLPFYQLSLFFSSYWSVVILRWGSIILGSICLLLIFKLTKRIIPDKNIACLVTFLVSSTPMFTFISSIVNNDIMVVLFFLLPLVLIEEGLSLGITIGLSMLVKPQLIILAPFYLIYLLRKKKLRLFLHLVPVLLSIAGLVLIYKNQYLTGGQNLFYYSVQNAQKSLAPLWRYPIEFMAQKQPIGIFMSFWGFFGWLNVPMPKWIYILFFSFFVFGCWGWWLNKKKQKVNYLLLGAFMLYLLTIIGFDLQVFALAHQFVIHGRYLAPLLPLLMIFLVNGILLFPTYLKKIILFYTIIIFLVSQILMLITIIIFY